MFQRHDCHPGSEPLQSCFDEGIKKAQRGLFLGFRGLFQNSMAPAIPGLFEGFYAPPPQAQGPLTVGPHLQEGVGEQSRGRVPTGRVEEAGTRFGVASEAWTPPPTFLTPWPRPLYFTLCDDSSREKGLKSCAPGREPWALHTPPLPLPHTRLASAQRFQDAAAARLRQD